MAVDLLLHAYRRQGRIPENACDLLADIDWFENWSDPHGRRFTTGQFVALSREDLRVYILPDRTCICGRMTLGKHIQLALMPFDIIKTVPTQGGPRMRVGAMDVTNERPHTYDSHNNGYRHPRGPAELIWETLETGNKNWPSIDVYPELRDAFFTSVLDTADAWYQALLRKEVTERSLPAVISTHSWCARKRNAVTAWLEALCHAALRVHESAENARAYLSSRTLARHGQRPAVLRCGIILRGRGERPRAAGDKLMETASKFGVDLRTIQQFRLMKPDECGTRRDVKFEACLVREDIDEHSVDSLDLVRAMEEQVRKIGS